MNLDEWTKQQGRGAMARLARETNIDYALLGRYRRREVIPGFGNAQRIESATAGAVTAQTLCTMKRKRAKPRKAVA